MTKSKAVYLSEGVKDVWPALLSKGLEGASRMEGTYNKDLQRWEFILYYD